MLAYSFCLFTLKNLSIYITENCYRAEMTSEFFLQTTISIINFLPVAFIDYRVNKYTKLTYFFS